MTAALIHDPAVHKLGRRRSTPTVRSRTMRAKFGALVDTLPPPPDALDRSGLLADAGVMLNNELGDCTIAAKGHLIQLWSAANGTRITVPDALILKAYEKWDGYVDGDPSTDTGGNMISVANDFCSDDVLGYKGDAYAVLDARNRLHVKQAIHRYGAVDLGVGLPTNAQGQDVWGLAAGDGDAAEPYSWGGHDLIAVGYDAVGVLLETWGIIKRATWEWFDVYADEAIAYFSKLWAPDGGTAPCGIASADLAAELQAVAG